MLGEGVIEMAKHGLVPAPTNVGERVKRTLLQVGVPAYLLLVVVVPAVLDVVLDALGESFPPQVVLVLAGAATTLTAVAGVVTKVMALPQVNDWLSRWTPFGTVPKETAKRIHENGV